MSEQAQLMERNVALIRRYIEDGFGRGNLDAIDLVLAPDCQRHTSGAVSSESGHVRRVVESFRAGMPDATVTIDQLVATPDHVVVRVTTRGTHTGEYLGVSPTGRTVEFAAMDMFRMADGKIVESWHSVDELGLLRQLGALPA